MAFLSSLPFPLPVSSTSLNLVLSNKPHHSNYYFYPAFYHAFLTFTNIPYFPFLPLFSLICGPSHFPFALLPPLFSCLLDSPLDIAFTQIYNRPHFRLLEYSFVYLSRHGGLLILQSTQTKQKQYSPCLYFFLVKSEMLSVNACKV